MKLAFLVSLCFVLAAFGDPVDAFHPAPVSLSGEIPISPEAPNGAWPKLGDDYQLSPNYTVTIDVKIAREGTVGGKVYVYVDNSVRYNRPDPKETEEIWMKTGPSQFKLTNTSADPRTAKLMMECTGA